MAIGQVKVERKKLMFHSLTVLMMRRMCMLLQTINGKLTVVVLFVLTTGTRIYIPILSFISVSL